MSKAKFFAPVVSIAVGLVASSAYAIGVGEQPGHGGAQGSATQGSGTLATRDARAPAIQAANRAPSAAAAVAASANGAGPTNLPAAASAGDSSAYPGQQRGHTGPAFR